MTVENVRIEEFVDRGNQITETVGATARICAQFLPKYELPPNTKSVTSTRINRATSVVDDVTTIPLTEIRMRFSLDWQQVSAGDLTTALFTVRKFAQAYCLLEDRLLLRGQALPPRNHQQLPLGDGQAIVLGQDQGLPPGGEVQRGQANFGLSGADAIPGDLEYIYDSIANGLSLLEDQTGPWAIVMGAGLFDQSDRRDPHFDDSPRQRIENLLGTKAYRTTILTPLTAILIGGAASPEDVSRSGEPMGPVDRAVALEPQLRFLGIDNQGQYAFAIVGSLALRVRDKDNIVRVEFE